MMMVMVVKRRGDEATELSPKSPCSLGHSNILLKLLSGSHSFSFGGLECKTFGLRRVNDFHLMPALKYYGHVINAVPLQAALAPPAIHQFAS